MSDAAEDLEDMIERGRDQPAEPPIHFFVKRNGVPGGLCAEASAEKMLYGNITGAKNARDVNCTACLKIMPKLRRSKPKKDTIAAWTARLNRLACELDEAAAEIHPGAWPEQLKQQLEKYRREAGKKI